MWVNEMYWEDFDIKSFDNCRQATINITEQGIRRKLTECIKTHNITESFIEYLTPYSYNLLHLPEWIYKDSHFDVEARIRRIYYSVKALDKLKDGVAPVNIDWVELLKDLTKDIEDNIVGYIDYARLFYVVNATTDKTIRLQIIDSVANALKIERASIVTIEENGVRFVPSDTPKNIDSVIDYLPYYRNWIELTDIPQHKPEYIPTSLTNKQLRVLLRLLKDRGFVSQAQTEEDFLNAFNPNTTKQGKIYWIKEARNREISPKHIVEFCVLFSNSDWFSKKRNSTMVQLLSAIFGVNTDIKRISAIRNESHSELYNTIQSLINIARNSAKK